MNVACVHMKAFVSKSKAQNFNNNEEATLFMR